MSKKPDDLKIVSNRGTGRDMPKHGDYEQPWSMRTRVERAAHKKMVEVERIGQRYKIRAYVAHVVRAAQGRPEIKGPVDGDFKAFYERAARRTRMGVIG